MYNKTNNNISVDHKKDCTAISNMFVRLGILPSVHSKIKLNTVIRKRKCQFSVTSDICR